MVKYIVCHIQGLSIHRHLHNELATRKAAVVSILYVPCFLDDNTLVYRMIH